MKKVKEISDCLEFPFKDRECAYLKTQWARARFTGVSAVIRVHNGAEHIPKQRQIGEVQAKEYFEASETTQIVLAFFHTFVVVALYHVSEEDAVVVPISIIAIIAGSLGIAAQNLHPPTIKACLGMQVVTCVGTVIVIIMHIRIIYPFYCDEEKLSGTMCKRMYESFGQLQLLQKLVMAVQVALSVTLAAYCCKVIECCSPSSGVPVITVERPADAQ
ncbi:hypothetical protein IRJ41_013329 [Triplophysa rosa]|uniref:Uncharacterized protein n=1 Tax=Triplophysa rosa TaxID=992332 RepID=A0A9W7X614_TRIRA|nr:hypothetical protein IRJ41_013329 [Triplophysa rosa]